MGKGYDRELSAKLDALIGLIFDKCSIEEYELNIADNLIGGADEKCYAVFITVCDTKARARVFHASGDRLREALDAARGSAAEGVKRTDTEPKWVKLEIVSDSEEVTPQETADRAFSSYNEFFRKGISLDRRYRYAYTEGEINGNRLLDYKNKLFDLRTFNQYTMSRDDDVILKTPKSIILFDCAGWFIDEKDKIYTLYKDGPNCGRRKTLLTKGEVKDVISTGVRYLVSQLHSDGSFDYGYYPIPYKLIPGYNIMRHTSTIWSLVCYADIERNSDVYRAARSAIGYMISQIRHFSDGCAYLIEESANEIKLGANGVAIITLSRFMKTYETDEYIPLCEELGRGILKMMDTDGTYVHVLEADTRQLKEESRTVYYDGEATFGLCVLHSMTGSSLWLEAARRAVDHFIEAGYAKYRDHWIAYAVNELTLYIKEDKYYEFALHNISANLDTIYKQQTTFHTYLELLMAGYETYRRAVAENPDAAYLRDFDIDKLARVIWHRAEHMLNGYGYPEYVMYLKKPNRFKGAFFVRHDGFRVRIDDVQHFCGAYIAFYKRYDEIKEMITSASNPSDVSHN